MRCQLSVARRSNTGASRAVYRSGRNTKSSVSSADRLPARGRLLAQRVTERRAAVPGLHGRRLHQGVRVLAGHPGADQLKQRRRGVDQAPGGVQVGAHPGGVDGQPLDQPGGQVQHVVGGDGGVGQRDPLDARVRDVPLVPQRDALGHRRHVPADHPGQPGDPLGADGVLLVRHRRGALLALAERLGQLADLGPLAVPHLQRDGLADRRGQGQRADPLGDAVAHDDLGGHVGGPEAERRA